MTVILSPGILHGSVNAVSSKSAAHRLLICAALSRAPSTLIINGYSEDTEATCRCIKALGGEVTVSGNTLAVTPIPENCGETEVVLDCGESGSTLRFMLPVAAGLGRQVRFTGRGRLAERPLAPLCEQLSAHGCTVSYKDGFPVTSGRASGGSYRIRGDISSQFITGLLLMLPLAGGGRVEAEGTLESSPYVDMTLSVLTDCGIKAERYGNAFTVSGGYPSDSRTVTAEGDWSNAAFWLVAGAVGGNVTVNRLKTASVQGDKAVVNLLSDMGAQLRQSDGSVTVTGGSPLSGREINVSDIPDLVPALAVAAAAADGKTVFTGAGRLAAKESNRLAAVTELIRSLGGEAGYGADTLTVTGKGRLRGGKVNAYNDHRIVMAAAVASALCDGEVVIPGAEAVRKSYPAFFEDFAALGGAVKEIV